jgi:hypothetical protein
MTISGKPKRSGGRGMLLSRSVRKRVSPVSVSVRLRVQKMFETGVSVFVDDGMPEQQNARLDTGHVARTEDRVRVPVEQRTQ